MNLRELSQFVKTENLIENGDRIVVGVSGGPDSMFLLHFLNLFKNDWDLTLSAAHVNHHTRGAENLKELNMIKEYCGQNNINFFIADFYKDKQHKTNFHDEARRFRYAFFEKTAETTNSNKIVLAHHQDDQVETILFKIIRGNNLSGYTGIKSSYPLKEDLLIVRPLLSLTKTEILSFCVKFQIPYATDSSNLDSKYTRNYLRHKIIPELKKIQPDLNHKIIQLQEQLAEANAFLEEIAKNSYQQMIISSEKERIILDLQILKQTPVSVIRVILYSVIRELTANQLDVNYEKVKNILNIIFNDKPNVVFNLGRHYFLIKEYDKLLFQAGENNGGDYFIEVNEFKDYILPEGMKIRVKKSEEKAKINNKSIILCYNNTIWPLAVRTKVDGDYIKTKIGKKKVNRVFIDAKIPVPLRKTWPLLVGRNGEVLWVIGLQKPEVSQLEDSQYIIVEVM